MSTDNNFPSIKEEVQKSLVNLDPEKIVALGEELLKREPELGKQIESGQLTQEQFIPLIVTHLSMDATINAIDTKYNQGLTKFKLDIDCTLEKYIEKTIAGLEKIFQMYQKLFLAFYLN